MPLLLAPNEHLGGTPDQRRALQACLNSLRAAPDPGPTRPGLTLTTLADLLTTPQPFLDPAVLHAGLRITGQRYRELGVTALLPPCRVFVAVASQDQAAFGGFHYPGQGYRHWQMTAFITRYGPLNGPGPSDPRLAALDLTRAYAHDSLHYATYRRYQWHPDGTTPVRVRYGINFRSPDGTPYSRPDPPGTTTTRNLGIIMEAATDREARTITYHTARATGITQPASNPDRAEYHELTGHPAPASLSTHRAITSQDSVDTAAFLARMTTYHQTVTARYAAFLAELTAAPDSLHRFILRAMITGSLAALCRTLNQDHGPAAFTRLFKTGTHPKSPAA